MVEIDGVEECDMCGGVGEVWEGPRDETGELAECPECHGVQPALTRMVENAYESGQATHPQGRVTVEVAYRNHETGNWVSTKLPAMQLDEIDGELAISFAAEEMDTARWIPTNQRAKFRACGETVAGTVRWFNVEHGVCALFVEVLNRGLERAR